MSYDIDLKIRTGAGRYAYVYDNNYTSNCSEMFYRAFRTEGIEKGLIWLDGKPATVAYPVLRRAVMAMQADQEWCLQNEPSNGWGNYQGALKFLAQTAQAAKLHPNAEFHLSY